MKKHYILKNKKRFYSIIISTIAIIFTIFAATSVYGFEQIKYEAIKVKNGDTLWCIAAKYNNNGDIRKYIHDIKKINNLSDGTIYEGNELIIPVNYR